MENTGNKKKVLVVGDWFVDEYWFVVRHHSDVSSHTGQLHYRIASEFGDAVRDLCGAGLVARILYELRTYKVDEFNTKIVELNTALGRQLGKEESDDKKESLKSWQKYLEGSLLKEAKEHGSCTLRTMRDLNDIIEELNPTVPNEPPIAKIKEAEIIEYQIKEPPAESQNRQIVDKQYEIVGWGRWNPEDNNIIKHLIHAHCHREPLAVRAPFSLTPKSCHKNVDAEIVNLEGEQSTHDTTRCIRAYNFVENEFKQIHRIDWELKSPSRQEQNPSASPGTAETDSSKTKAEFSDVIICDFKKGVIDQKMIEKIKAAETDPTKLRWYIRTKSSRVTHADPAEWPSWLHEIDEIELLAIGPEIACRAYPINGLLSDGRLAEHAYRLINDVIFVRSGRGLNRRKVCNVVLTSDKLEVVVLLGNYCFVAKPQAEIPNIELQKVNWTTAFFAALVHQMVTTANWPGDEQLCSEMVTQAVKNAHAHSGVTPPKVQQAPTERGCRIDLFGAMSDAEVHGTRVRKVCDWSKMRDDWKEAKSDMGLIKVNGQNSRLEVWRASTDLPGYIACITEKRQAIGRIWQKINAFTQKKDVRTSLSILLEADPAVGKSFLAKKLSERLQCELIKHDITQMIDREELLDLFDMVANAQANSSKPVFVFVDEINATLGGSSVYGAFLSPLEGRKYLRQGQQIELQPCIWMFAGTPRSSGRGDDNRQDEKRRISYHD